MNILFIFLIIGSFSAWGKVNLELQLNEQTVKQGQIAKGKLIVRESTGNSGLSGLKGKTLNKTLYLLSLSPFMGKNGVFESDAKIIFTQVPQTNSVSEVINDEEIVIGWNDVQVSPTEATDSFLFGSFDVPERVNFFPWILFFIIIIICTFVFIKMKSFFKIKSSVQRKKLDLKNEILCCNSYEDLVLFWRQKNRYLEAFPAIEDEFKQFEKVLFKYQFKPQRSETEVKEILEAYEFFKSKVAGVLNGI